jgi:carbamoyltransferase
LFALGLSQDLYLGGVAVSRGGALLHAANEERYTRVKNQGGFPHRALARVLEGGIAAPAEVGDICICGITTPPLPLRLMPGIHGRISREQAQRSESVFRHLADFVVHHTPASSQRAESAAGRVIRRMLPGVMRGALPPELRRARLHFAEHHAAHAFGGYWMSGFGRALCITSDGMGDGISLTVNSCEGESVTRIYETGIRDSLGLFFEALTEAFGFVPSRDEGKITGLAANGARERVAVENPFEVNGGRLRYRGPHGLRAVQWVRHELLERYPREDVAAWAQWVLEESLARLAQHWLAQTGHERLVLSGGTVANVKLNQRLHELPEVRELFVYPNMGDGGNAVGALAVCGFLSRARVRDVFLGDGFSEAEMEEAMRAAGVTFRRMQDPAREVAALLAAGRIVARFDGRMEWGPRALGNRSVLAAATTPDIMAILNDRLKRSDFMPFAPAILEEEAERLLSHCESGLLAGEFMTVCYACSDEMKRHFPAVVHVDGTARAQIVRRDCNPGFHALLSAYREHAGAGVLLNTSFNMHEEPIVRTPAEAIAAFTRGRLDYLAMGPFLIEGRG